MSVVRIALLQMAGRGLDQEANQVKGDVFCRRAAALGADMALFPEMWNIGYAPCPRDEAGRKEWQAQAVSLDDTFGTPLQGARSGAGYGDSVDLPGALGRCSQELRNSHRPARRDRDDLRQGAHLRLLDGGRVYPWRGVLRMRSRYGKGRCEGWRNDLLRPRVPGERPESSCSKGRS